MAGLLPLPNEALNRALRNGGYDTSSAAVVYRLRHSPLPILTGTAANPLLGFLLNNPNSIIFFLHLSHRLVKI